MSLAFSPDGKFLATQDNQETVRVWEIESRKLVAHFAAAGRPRFATENLAWGGVLRFSPDGNQLAFQNRFSGIRVVDWRSGTNTLVIKPHEGKTDDPMTAQVTALAFSPHGDLLVWGVGKGTIHLWDMAKGKEAGELSGHQNAVLALVFTPDGKRLASASADQTIRIWDLGNHSELHCLRGNENEVRGLGILPDGKTLVSGGKDGSVRLWDLTLSENAPLDRTLPVVFTRFTSQGQHFLAVGEPHDSLSLWNTRSLRKIETLSEFGDNIYFYGISSDDRWLALAHSDEHSVRIWDWSARREVINLVLPKRPIGCGFTADGKFAWAAYNLDTPARTLGQVQWWKAWKTGSWEEVNLDWLKPNISMGHLSPTGQLVVIGYETGEIELRKFPEGQLIAPLAGYSSRVRDIRFSPDGRMVAATSSGDFAKVWDVQTQKELMTLRSHFPQSCVEFSPDSQRLAVGCVGGNGSAPRVELWDLATQRILVSLKGAGRDIWFSPDSTLITSKEVGIGVWRTHAWRAPSWKEIEAAERVRDPSSLGKLSH